MEELKKLLAEKINANVDLPILTEDQEQILIELILTVIFDFAMGFLKKIRS